MTVTGIDVYSGNGHVDFAKARDEDGVRFVLRKATQGVTYTDPAFGPDFDAIGAVGLLPGAYHFAHNGANQPTAEANHFLSVLGLRRHCLLALDLEDHNDGKTLWQRAAWSLIWLEAVYAATGIKPFVYTYHSWAFSTAFDGIRAAGYPMWIPLDPAGADPMVQSTHVLGTLGNLDVDTFSGTLDDLRALAGITAPIPVPQPSGDDMPYLIRSPDGEIDLVLGGAIVHLAPSELPTYTHLTIYPVGQREADAARAKVGA